MMNDGLMNSASNLIYNDWNDRQCSISDAASIKECTICGAPSNGYHFNAPSCSACAAFFRRTVTLNRNFVCNQHNCCRVNYAMRVICRACRYAKCIQMGMERSAVQPRRDCNAGRRKILYQEVKSTYVPAPAAPIQPQQQPSAQYSQIIAYKDELKPAVKYARSQFEIMQMDSSPEIHYAQSYSSSISEEASSPKLPFSYAGQFTSKDFEAEQLLDELLREERLFNDRRKLLYCSHSSLTNLLTCEDINDIPFTTSDLQPLTYAGIQKLIRPQILVIYEWLRGWRHFNMLNSHDRLIFLRRCVLYHTVLDPSYLTYRLGLPDKYIFFNGSYVAINEDDQTGWEDEENCISAELKKKLYRPLMKRQLNEIVSSMQAINLSFEEFVLLKALVSFKSAACSDISASLKSFMNSHLDLILKALNLHYQSLGLSPEEIAQRTGNVVLMMSSVFAVGMECLESHQKIQFFDLWQLDDLLIKLISRGSSTG